MLLRILATICVLVGLTSSANAEEKKKRALVVPTDLGGYFPKRSEWRREFNAALENRLQSARFTIANSDVLSKTEVECSALECLKSIVKTHDCDVVVAGSVHNDEQRLTSYHIRVRLIERLPSGDLAGREKEVTCPNCTEKDAKNMLATMMSATLANEPEPPIIPPDNLKPPPPKPPENDPPPLPATKPEDRLSRGPRLILRGVGFGLVGVGVLGLAQGFVDLSHQGDPVKANGRGGCGTECPYRLDTSKGQNLFFSLGAVTAIVGATLAAVSWIPMPKKRVTVTPSLSPASATLHLEAHF